MYTFCIIMIAIASILLILAVLVQSPKSGMAANFGAANQTMGVRQTTDSLVCCTEVDYGCSPDHRFLGEVHLGYGCSHRIFQPSLCNCYA